MVSHFAEIYLFIYLILKDALFLSTYVLSITMYCLYSDCSLSC